MPLGSVFFNNYDPLLSEMTKGNRFNSYKDDVICKITLIAVPLKTAFL